MAARRSKNPYLIDLEVGYMRLKSKPSAKLSFSLLPGKSHSNHANSLIIFLSGLENPQSIWKPTITAFVTTSQEEGWPTMLTYDRFGSGRSDRDPADIGKDPDNWHDVLDVVRDLRELVISIADTRPYVQQDINKLRIILVGHSLGCAVARLYAQTHPRTVTHLLLLDSAPSIRDPVAMIPDPLSLDFRESDLPLGITAEMCGESRANFRKSSHNPNAANSEGLNWKHLIDQLPHPNEPMLEGPDGAGPFITIIKHDPIILAKQYREVS
jgi:pimeloyl-ACP methyl ester carboxylesterase